MVRRLSRYAYPSATTTVITISLNASFAQIYGIQIIAIGRWK